MSLRTKRVLTIAPLLIAGLIGVAWTSGWLAWWPQQFCRQALARRDYDAALDWARQAAHLNADDAETEFLLARVERKLGHLDQSEKHLDRAAKLGLEHGPLQREKLLAQAQTGRLDGILAQLDEMLVDQRGDGAEICEAYANGLLVNGQIHEAEGLIQQWSQAFPSDPLPDHLRGRLAEHRHAYTDAERHYHEALRKDARHFPSTYSLGRSLIELHRWQEAHDCFQRCLVMRVPGPAQFGMARCLSNLGHDEQARELLLRAAAVPQATLIEAFKRVGESTEFDQLRFELGTLEAKLSHYADAAQWLEQAIAYNSKHRQAHYQLALALKALGREDEAQSHLIYFTSIQKKLDELDHLHDVIQRQPDDLESRFQLGMLYLEIDSDAAGLFWLRGVLSRDPEHRATRAALADYYSKKAATDPQLRSLVDEPLRQSAPERKSSSDGIEAP